MSWSRRHPVLILLSEGYPRDKGRLHTRYAPVRPVAGGIATPLPLDLHVLGPPLAFILSQDQTLHCKNRQVTYLRRVPKLFVHFCLALSPEFRSHDRPRAPNVFKELHLFRDTRGHHPATYPSFFFPVT